jgi:hypothetical protein
MTEYAFRGAGLSSCLGMLAMDRRPQAVLTIGTFVFHWCSSCLSHLVFMESRHELHLVCLQGCVGTLAALHKAHV